MTLQPEALLNAHDYERASRATPLGTAEPGQVGFDHLFLRPRIMVDVEHCSTETRLLGKEVPVPFLADVTGDRHVVRGANASGLPVLRAAVVEGAEPDEDVANGWIQVAPLQDRGLFRDTIRRAVAGGATAVVVDAEDPGLTGRSYGAPVDAEAGWDVVELAVASSDVPVVVRGVLRAEDATRAIDIGAKGLIVSAESSRLVSAVEALPPVVEETAGRADVLVATAFRRGADVFKALALGATGCLLGDVLGFGGAVGQEAGVAEVIALLQRELQFAMENCGVASVAEMGSDLVGRVHPWRLGSETGGPHS